MWCSGARGFFESVTSLPAFAGLSAVFSMAPSSPPTVNDPSSAAHVSTSMFVQLLVPTLELNLKHKTFQFDVG